MVNILIAPDKFKGSLSALEVCRAVSEGLVQSQIKHAVTMVPLADGGEGTFDLLTQQSNGVRHTAWVNDPLFQPREASFGISGDGTTAFIEMAQASGLQLIAAEKRNPLNTSTFGTGELIRAAMNMGVTTLVLGIGGSATNDAGIGMAAALGYEFFDSGHQLLKPVGSNLIHLHSIHNGHVPSSLKNLRVIVLCDVTNPLHGEQGAAFVYAPQKGASAGAVKLLDEGLRNFETAASRFFKTDLNFPGAGAAGGLGAGCKVFLKATFFKGIDYIFKTTDLEKKMEAADIVITGEGKLDGQSLSGKVVMEVSKMASRLQKPVIAICGKNELPDSAIAHAGIQSVLSLMSGEVTDSEAMKNARDLIKKRVVSHFSSVR
jgi:glycerate kinase